MTQPPRYGLNKEARLAAERREQEADKLAPPFDPTFPYVCLPNPFSDFAGVELSLPVDTPQGVP
ncbi:MAG: hypothetical protein IAE97_07115 [Chthoniobacterales bacterium]|nr:hypothetical protein [Chthoniobacterales bacterium]